jgi:hypothetical protein
MSDLQTQLDQAKKEIEILSNHIRALEQPSLFDRPEPQTRIEWKETVELWAMGVKLQIWDLSDADQIEWLDDPAAGSCILAYSEDLAYRPDPEVYKHWLD